MGVLGRVSCYCGVETNWLPSHPHVSESTLPRLFSWSRLFALQPCYCALTSPPQVNLVFVGVFLLVLFCLLHSGAFTYSQLKTITSHRLTACAQRSAPHAQTPSLNNREAYQAVKADVPLMAKLPLLTRKQLLERAARLGLTPPVAPSASGELAEERSRAGGVIVCRVRP
jgi:hypothetical protein